MRTLDTSRDFFGSEATSSAYCNARDWNSSSEYTSVTNPNLCASRALNFLLNTIMAVACNLPIIFGNVYELAASADCPKLVNGQEKYADSEASTKSHRPRCVHPIPIAGPLTIATIGLGKSIKASANVTKLLYAL